MSQPSLKITAPRSVYFAIFAISGFSGLIYESIWSHYLKLFLGHAAYAQSLVLVIFMGGMAAGSWLASRYSSKMRIPILAYAAVEAIVGIIALVFHDMFAGLIDVFHSSILPGVNSPAAGITLKWGAASLLILPQSILLGMTFPLMSAGVLRRFPTTPGGSIAMLYFTNSIGAAIGVLASGFVFIKAFGLPGTIMTAGLLNLALAVTVWVMVRLDPDAATEPMAATQATKSRDTLQTLFLLAAFITGAASFIYEISWIRMLSLVLGATTHSFELMLSAFITGLAFGGLWIKRRIDRVADPVQFSGYVQLIMGLFALLTVPVYVMSFDWMVWLRGALQNSDAAFSAYNVASHSIALIVMLPTTFMAGMTLPLFTYVLLQRGSGEASIGRVYAFNTVGAIVGVLFAVHIGLPYFGLKNLIAFGASLDILLGLFLLFAYASMPWRKLSVSVPAIAIVLASCFVMFTSTLDQRLLISGVYRYKRTTAAANDDILFYKDGKTASVVFRMTPKGEGVLATNGKPDASIQLQADKPATLDEATMIVAAALPMAYAPDARTVANIGMGSGQTAHTLLGNPRLEVVDTIEIEQQMVEASRNYGDAVRRVYEDPRSNIHIEDAKTFFSLNNSHYDIIVAEPSNPWVSGVSSLFSSEFYATVIDYMEDDGIFVQWIQMYEFTDELSVSIMKSLAANFDDFAIYLSNSSDVIIIARKQGELGEPDWGSVLQGDVGEMLARVNINSPADLAVRQSAVKSNIAPYLEDLPVAANSDYFPFVDLNAGKAMFLGSTAPMFSGFMLAPVPVLEMINNKTTAYADVSPGQHLHRAERVDAASWLYEKLMSDSFGDPEEIRADVAPMFRYGIDWMKASAELCSAEANVGRWSEAVFDSISYTLSYLDREQAIAYVAKISETSCGALDDLEQLAWMQLYEAVAARDAQSMYVTSRAILDNADPEDNNRKAYLINAAMLGAVVGGQLELGHDVWLDYGKAFYSIRDLPPYTGMLLSMSARFEDEP